MLTVPRCPLEQAAEAYRYFESDKKKGNIVYLIGSDLRILIFANHWL